MHTPDTRWWLIEDAEERAREAWSKAVELHSKQGITRHQDAMDCLALYQAREYRGLSLVYEDCPTFNVIAQCVDTRANHVFRNKVRPMFLTEGGSYEDQQRARGMQRLVEGEFYRVGMYGELGMDVCWDGEVWEAGGVKIYPDHENQRVVFERVFPWEVLVDERDARYGAPTVLCQVHHVDRAVLLSLYPGQEHQDAIENAHPSSEGSSVHLEDQTVSDQVMVIEWWHLPSTRVDRDDDEQWDIDTATHDGVHIICVENHALFEEAWPLDCFPIAWYKPDKERMGYWSCSAPKALLGSQVSLNRMAERMDQSMHLCAVPRLYVNRSAKVDTRKLTNGIGEIIEGNLPAGAALQQITAASMPAEYIQRYERIIQQAKEQRGISELSAAAKKPAGIESKVALQHLSDTEAVRHTAAYRAWERFHLDAARVLIESVRMLARGATEGEQEQGADYEVMFGDDEELERIKWRDVDLPDSRFVLKVWPTNLLSQEPAAKLEQVIMLAEKGILDQQELKAALDFPDIKAAMSDSGAETKNIARKLDLLVRGVEGKEAMRAQPHPYMNLAMAQMMGQKRYNQLEADGADDAILDRVRQFLEDVDSLIAKAQAAPPPAAAEMGGQAPGLMPPGPGGPPMGPPPGPPPPGMG